MMSPGSTSGGGVTTAAMVPRRFDLAGLGGMGVDAKGEGGIGMTEHLGLYAISRG